MKSSIYTVAVVALLAGSGCISPTFVANKAGFLSGVGYLAVNNPPAKEVKAVKTVLDKVNKYVGKLKLKDTFASLYAPIRDEVGDEFSGATKILALSVARTALDGLDVLFMAHPSWSDKKETVVSLTKEFMDGVNKSFSTFANSEEMRAGMARLRAASVRAYSSGTTH